MTATYSYNEERGGIEVYFEERPPQNIIDMLKSGKWRWHNVKKCWYANRTEATQALAESIATSGAFVESTTPETVNIHGVNAGDIFYTSWGYEQTNVDYFQVVAVSPKMATVKPIKQRQEPTAWLQGKCKPIRDAFIADSPIFKEQYKTQTAQYGDSKPVLKNTDGRGNRGHHYTGGSISYSSYH